MPSNDIRAVHASAAPPTSVADWLALQGRFAHLLAPENAPVLEEIQQQVEEDWAALRDRCGDLVPAAR